MTHHHPSPLDAHALVCGLSRHVATATQLTELGSSQLPEFRLFAAMHSACPAMTVEALTRDTEPAVRAAVALRGDAPVEVLRLLARDPDPSVRAAVALNPSLPEAEVVALADDFAPDVRTQIATRRDLPARCGARLLLDTSVSVLVAMASRPDLDKEAVALLARRHQLVSYLARNPRLSPSDLRLFATWSLVQDHGRAVWGDLLRNPSLPLSALAALYFPVRLEGSREVNDLFNDHPVLSSVSLQEVLTLLDEGDEQLRERLLFLALDEATPFGSYVTRLISDIDEELRATGEADDFDGADLPNDIVLMLAPLRLMWEPVPAVL